MTPKRYFKGKNLIVGGLAVGLIMSLTGCMHKYKAVKKDGSVEYIKGYYIIPTDGDYVKVRGTWKTTHILRVESIRQVD